MSPRTERDITLPKVGELGESQANRRQAQVPAPCAIGAVILQVIQERPEEWGIQVFHRQLRRWLVQSFLSELQQQAEGIPIGNDRMWARPSLSDETLCEECFQQGGKVGGFFHRRPPHLFSIRFPAAPSSSGVLVRYQ